MKRTLLLTLATAALLFTSGCTVASMVYDEADYAVTKAYVCRGGQSPDECKPQAQRIAEARVRNDNIRAHWCDTHHGDVFDQLAVDPSLGGTDDVPNPVPNCSDNAQMMFAATVDVACPNQHSNTDHHLTWLRAGQRLEVNGIKQGDFDQFYIVNLGGAFWGCTSLVPTRLVSLDRSPR